MNKLLLTTLFVMTAFSICLAQDNPYAIFGHKVKVKYEDNKDDTYRVRNANLNSIVKYIEFDKKNKTLQLLDSKDSVLQKVAITDENLLRWATVDPIAAKYPQYSPYSYTINNPIKYIDPNGMEIGLAGEQEALDAYLRMLYTHTGNNYAINNGKLTFVGTDKNFKGTKSKTLADIITKGINSKDMYSLTLVGAKGDDNAVFVDSYQQGKIDVTDLAKMGEASSSLQAAAIGHFLNEIQEVPGYATADAAAREAAFNSAHNPSLGMEGKIYGELIGDPSITSRMTIPEPPSGGFQNTIFSYNATNQFILRQGATSKSMMSTIDINGVKLPTTVTTVVPTGILNSVTKKPQ